MFTYLYRPIPAGQCVAEESGNSTTLEPELLVANTSLGGNTSWVTECEEGEELEVQSAEPMAVCLCQFTAGCCRAGQLLPAHCRHATSAGPPRPGAGSHRHVPPLYHQGADYN